VGADQDQENFQSSGGCFKGSHVFLKNAPKVDWMEKKGSLYWHKKAWSKDLIKPSAWRSHMFDEDWWRST